MALYPSNFYRRNLERFGDDIQGGAWSLTPLVDLISERRYLLYTLARGVARLAPSVLSFRGEAAAEISPATCPRLLSVSVEGDRLELLTGYCDLLDAPGLDDPTLRAVFEAVVETLARFEQLGFQCGELSAQSIARGESGIVILPNGYILPPLGEVDASETPAEATKPPTHTPHLRQVQRLFRHYAGRKSGFRGRLLRASEAIDEGEVRNLADLHRKLFGHELAPEFATLQPPGFPSRPDDELTPYVDEVVAAAGADGSILVLRGDAYAGKTQVLRQAAEQLAGIGHRVTLIDEWELFARGRRPLAGRGKGAGRTVWMVDDVDEKTAVASDFCLSLMHDQPTRGAVIMAVHTDASKELTRFLGELGARRKERYREIVIDALNPSHEKQTIEAYLRFATEQVESGRAPGKIGIEAFLATLATEERQLLELLAVSRFAMPLDLVLSVFPDRSGEGSPIVHRLLCIKCLELFYRRLAPRNLTTLFVRVENTALRRRVYRQIPAARRKRLHRTLALLAEQSGGFPTFFLLFHSLESGSKDLAAKHVVAYLKDTDSEHRHPFLTQMCLDLTRRRMLAGMPFADQIFTYHQLAAEQIKSGNGAEAETLLRESKSLIEAADSDQVLKNASTIAEIYRLLADRWEALGEFKQALDLLENAKNQLRSALPIPDQAQLLNDIGWLQFRLGDYEPSIESCRLSLNTLNATQYPLIVAQALNLMGVVHFNTSRYDEAISYYEQSAYLRERSGDENALAASSNNLALAYQSKGEYEKALEYYNRSLELKRRRSNQAGIAGGYLNLALLHLEMRDFEEAAAKCRESLAISIELENVQLAADNYITLGDIALEGGDLEAAENHYKHSYRISHEREAISEEMGALRRLSTISLKQKRFAEAREYANQADELVQRIGSKYENAQIQVVLGDLELEEKNQTEALKHYERAAGQYISLSKFRLAATVLSKIGLIHARSGNDFEARHSLDRAQEFVRADFGRELPEEFVELQQILRAHPARTQLAGKETQKLLMAFYDLSALTDYAVDGDEFFAKIMDVTRRIVDPTDCYLALKTAKGFVLIDERVERDPVVPKHMQKLFDLTLRVGGLVDSEAPDAAGLAVKLKLPKNSAFVCIPLKAMSEDLGCLLYYLSDDRLPLSNEDVNFFTWLGRQIAGNLKLMLHLNEGFLAEELGSDHGARVPVEEQERYRFENLIGKSEQMKRIFRTLEKVKATDSGILILGESGTGKSALARAAHFASPRAKRPFQEIHCAQIPHNLLESELFGHERGSFTGAVQRKLGLCEVADGGTVFLDDINVLPVETQTKLLHFLESKSFMRLGGTQRLTSDVRIIAASNENLEELVKKGRFREDLYYRLKVILLELPPLRERKEDLLAIALDYLKRSCDDKGIPLKTLAPETIQLLQRAPWRGNVRELQNVLERVVILSDENLITPASLPEDFLKEVMGTSQQSHQKLDDLVDEIVRLGSYSESSPLLPVLEAVLAKKMVEHADGKSRAASLLGISKPTLYARLRDYDKMH